MLRVLLDTNVVVSSLLSPLGPSARIVDAWRHSRVTLISYPLILAEVQAVLNYPRIRRKYAITDEEVAKLLNLFRKHALLVTGEAEKITGVITADPEDEKFLDCALEARANFIVSGDHHLLDLKSFRAIQIITARQFVEQYLQIEENN
jgi:putative PIN family toxin of toxin-antitoxin system